MANRQYIGARYVPKFYEGSNGSNWENGVSYEPLTVVQYLNDSYTSKKPVPVNIGNPANNPNYWAHTGAYNAQVEQYKEEVEEAIENFDTFVDNTENIYVNVKDFGAVGDGIANDADAINDAIDSVSETGGVVIIGKGIYKVSSPIHVPLIDNPVSHSQITLILAGCEIIAGATNMNIIDIGGEPVTSTPYGVINVKGYGACINCNTLTNVKGIMINNTTCDISGIDIRRIGEGGIGIQNGNNNTSTRVHIHDCRISGSGSDYNNIGLYTRSPESTYTNLWINMCKIGISHHGTSGDFFDHIYIWAYSYNLWTEQIYKATIGVDLHGRMNCDHMYTDSCYKHFNIPANTEIEVVTLEAGVGSYETSMDEAIIFNVDYTPAEWRQLPKIRVNNFRPYSNRDQNSKLISVEIPSRAYVNNIYSRRYFQINMDYRLRNMVKNFNDFLLVQSINEEVWKEVSETFEVDNTKGYLIGYVNDDDYADLTISFKARGDIARYIFAGSTLLHKELLGNDAVKLYVGASVTDKNETYYPVYVTNTQHVQYAGVNVTDNQQGDAVLFKLADTTGVSLSSLTEVA